MNPTDSERQRAALVHIAAIFMPYAGPIAGLVLAGSSGYVRFHAFRSLIGQVVTTLLTGTVVLISLGHTLFTLWNAYQAGNLQIDWLMVIAKSLGVWLGLSLFALINTIGSIRSAHAAWTREDWGGRNPVDRMARRISRGRQPRLPAEI